MKAIGWKEIGLVAVAVLLNALLLSQLVAGPRGSSAIAFAQPYQDGDPCNTPSQCASGFCTDGVCCDTLCNGPG